MWTTLCNGNLVKCSDYKNVSNLGSNLDLKNKQNQNQVVNTLLIKEGDMENIKQN